MERKNDFPFGICDDDDLGIHANIDMSKLKDNKNLAKKVDVAISYSPSDSEIKLYLLLCEAKKPNTNQKEGLR